MIKTALRPIRQGEAGQTLIEPLLAMALIGLLLAPFLGAITNLAHSQEKYRHQTEATQYAREGLEITYNLVVNHTGEWENFVISHLGATTLPKGRFTREVTLEKARRNNDDGNISDETADTWEDINTLKVISKVLWSERGKNEKVELTTYLISLEF